MLMLYFWTNIWFGIWYFLLIGKYYLVDDGYPTFVAYLEPYKGERYHFLQFRNGPRVKGRIKLFNYLHFSLQSIIKWSFGCCKARWKILINMPSFPLVTQIQIIVICMALHNFIRRFNKDDDVFTNFVMKENYVCKWYIKKCKCTLL